MCKKIKASVPRKPSVRCHCCCCRHCDCLNSKSWKNIVKLNSDFSVSGFVFIKLHPIKYMRIEKKTSKKNLLFSNRMSNVRLIFFAVVTWLHEFA